MMAKIDDFLSIYKDLETELRDNNMTVLDFETTLPTDDADKLKICRQIRNYVQHHSDIFLSATPEMCTFIKNVLENVKASKEKVKDRTKRVKALLETDKLEDVCKWMSKNKKEFAPVVDKNGLFLGVITTARLITRLTTLSLKSKVKELRDSFGDKSFGNKIYIASPAVELERYEFGTDIIVVDKGKYKGIVKW